jgi:hypothetical protein
MISEGYSMDLYCRHARIEPGQVSDDLGHRYDEFPHMFTGPNREYCARQARRRGWVFHRDGDVSCPKCSK